MVKSFRIHLAVSTEYRHVTDKWTARQMDRQTEICVKIQCNFQHSFSMVGSLA